MDSFHKMSQNSNSPKRRRVASGDSFLEAFKNIGTSLVKSAKEDVAKGTFRSAADQLFNQAPSITRTDGELSPNQKIDFEKIIESEKEKNQEVIRGFYERTHRQENLVFSKREEEIKIQLQVIRGEIKKLIEVTKEVAKETEKVAMEEVVAPGTYHVNFFEKIRSLLALARKRIEESRSWLSLWKSRSKKRNYYWGQVRKSGTKFMLSQERYMSTQMG